MQAKRVVLFLALLVSTLSVFAAGPTTRANDDSCDIALLPAATLLLPFFEVDFTDSTNETTLLTVTNVSAVSQVARVTLWTDFAYPVLSFNVYLTGYDTQSISLFDVIAHGIIGSGSGTGTSRSHVGAFSDPNAQLDATACGDLPGRIDTSLVTRMQTAFTEGVTGTCDSVGYAHEFARGYATIDLVGNCSSANPTDPEYFTNDIRYDNVLIGDYQQVSGKLKYAQVSPMVHIRAVPEGGTPSLRADASATYANRFTNTFYGRYQSASAPNADARQPLPSRFAVRWINGGIGGFETSFKIWRQSLTGRDTDCAKLEQNGMARTTDTVVFDSEENGEGVAVESCQVLCVGDGRRALPATSLTSITDSEVFPQALKFSTTAGWIYLNFDDANLENGAHQNWVVVSMRASGDFSGDMDGTALGNGCSPAVGLAEESESGSVVIGPAVNGEP